MMIEVEDDYGDNIAKMSGLVIVRRIIKRVKDCEEDVWEVLCELQESLTDSLDDELLKQVNLALALAPFMGEDG